MLAIDENEDGEPRADDDASTSEQNDVELQQIESSDGDLQEHDEEGEQQDIPPESELDPIGTVSEHCSGTHPRVTKLVIFRVLPHLT